MNAQVVNLTPRADHAATERTGPPAPVGRMVYTVKEVAHMLSLNLGGTYALIRSGDIPAIKLGGRWAIPKRRFHEWLDSCIDPTSEPDTGEGSAAVQHHPNRHGA